MDKLVCPCPLLHPTDFSFCLAYLLSPISYLVINRLDLSLSALFCDPSFEPQFSPDLHFVSQAAWKSVQNNGEFNQKRQKINGSGANHSHSARHTNEKRNDN